MRTELEELLKLLPQIDRYVRDKGRVAPVRTEILRFEGDRWDEEIQEFTVRVGSRKIVLTDVISGGLGTKRRMRISWKGPNWSVVGVHCTDTAWENCGVTWDTLMVDGGSLKRLKRLIEDKLEES